MQLKFPPEQIARIWETYLNTGSIPDEFPTPWHHSKSLRPLVHRLPSEPRCLVCYYPFEGLGGVITQKLLGLRPSTMNPNICNQCEQFIQEAQGGAEVPVTMLFADIRGSTTIAEKMRPEEFSRFIKRFYNTTTRILFDRNAIVEKLIGDEVTAVFTRGFAGEDHARVAIDAGKSILQATQGWAPVGIGIHTGLAYIGALSKEAEISVLGDTPNTASRLASLAKAGEILLSCESAIAAGIDVQTAAINSLELKGRSEALKVISLGAEGF